MDKVELRNEWMGRSRGGRTSKIHLCVDGNGRPLSLIVTAGQRADVSQLLPVLDAIAVPRLGRGRPKKRPPYLRVDRAYGARKPRKLLQRRGIRCICPERADAKKYRQRRGSRGGCPPSFDPEQYKGRNVVERAINRLKDFRAVATRYDKRGHNYLAVVTVAAIVIWLL
jgi:transposase